MKIPSPQQIHDIKRFYDILDAIPAEKWCQCHYTDNLGRHCVMGHLKAIGQTKEFVHLWYNVFRTNVTLVNDMAGGDPKTNILNTLQKALNFHE